MKIDLIYKIAEKYNAEIIQIKSGDEYCNANGEYSYIDKSYSAGHIIYLGIYSDINLKIAAFLHELGHIIDPIDWSVNANKNTKIKAEFMAWHIAVNLANVYKIKITNEATQYILESLNSYIK